MTKKLLLAAVLAGVTASAFAIEKGPTLTLSGSLDTQYGMRSEKNFNKYITGKDTTSKRRQARALVNDTKLRVDIHGKAHGLTYGGHVTLNADTSANKYNQKVGATVTALNQAAAASSVFGFYNESGTAANNVGYETEVFVESFLGRLQAGSSAGAYNALSVSAARVAHATGGASAGDTQYWTHPTRNLDFITSGSFYTDAASGAQQQAAKFTYFTPTYMGFKAGVSYIPDLNQTGSVATTMTVGGKSGTFASGNSGTLPQAATNPAQYGAVTTMDFKGIVSGGLHYAGKISHVGVEAAVLAEGGKAKKSTDGDYLDLNGYRKLSAKEAGLKLSYHHFQVAGSVASLGRSGLNKTSKIARSGYWTLGAAYDYSNWGVSVTYMNSKKGALPFTPAGAVSPVYKANKQKNLSVGVDYKLAPGFMPYVEYTAFKQTYANSLTATSTYTSPVNSNNKGSVVLAGTKLQF